MQKGISSGAIANQVFVGCPWKTTKAKYEDAIDQLRKTSPLSFVIVGRGDKQDAAELLEIIKNRLESSSYAIFDATGGNANVSLEYGYAEGRNIRRAIYSSTHGKVRPDGDAAIIADLAGKKRNHYKQLRGLRKLLGDLSSQHAYSRRFEVVLQKHNRRLTKGEKKTFRALALKATHLLDGQEKLRRFDLVQGLQSQGYAENQIEDVIKTLHIGKLIYATKGRYSDVSIR